MIENIPPSSPCILELDKLDVEHPPLGWAISQVMAHGPGGDRKLEPDRVVRLLQQAMEVEPADQTEEEIFNEALKKQTEQLKNLLRGVTSTKSSIDQLNPDRIPSSVKGYRTSLEFLEKCYLERSVIDLLLSGPPEGLEYEHWSALVAALEKKFEINEGELRVNAELSDLIKQGFVKRLDRIEESSLQSLALAAKRYTTKHDKSAVFLEFHETEMDDEQLLVLLKLFDGLPMRGLSIAHNPVHLANGQAVDLLKSRVSSPFFSLVLPKTGPDEESLQLLHKSTGPGSMIETK